MHFANTKLNTVIGLDNGMERTSFEIYVQVILPTHRNQFAIHGQKIEALRFCQLDVVTRQHAAPSTIVLEWIH